MLVKKLHEKKVPVYLISGGFRCIIEPIAAQLKVPMTNVFANELLFNSTGIIYFVHCLHFGQFRHTYELISFKYVYLFYLFAENVGLLLVQLYECGKRTF